MQSSMSQIDFTDEMMNVSISKMIPELSTPKLIINYKKVDELK